MTTETARTVTQQHSRDGFTQIGVTLLLPVLECLAPCYHKEKYIGGSCGASDGKQH